MKRFLLACMAALMFVAPAAAVPHHRVVVVAPAWGWGWYSPFWSPYPYAYGYYPAQPTGEVKIDTKAKDAEVFIDGAYAGTVGKLKNKMDLRPGTYDIELRQEGQTTYSEKVYVVAGKTLHLRPDLNPQPQG